MKKIVSVMALLGGLLFVSTDGLYAMVSGGVWHDAEEMAIAIDLNHYEWQYFNRMELDFNADRVWGQIIDGSEWVTVGDQKVRRFEFGVYRNYQYADGQNVRYFGWSYNPLFENENRTDWFVYIDKLYFGEKSPESFQCYAHEWAPLIDKKIVYCHTIDLVGNKIPVLASDLQHIFVRHEYSEWIPVSEISTPLPPVALQMRVLPNLLSKNSNGKYVTAIINLPDKLVIDEDDIDLLLRVEVTNQAGDTIDEVHLQSLKWSSLEKRISKGVRQLLFKFPRNEFLSLPSGQVSIVLSGQIAADQSFVANGSITIK